MMVSRYQADGRRPAISGPLLDRADLRSDDIHIEVPRIEADWQSDEKLSDEQLGESLALFWSQNRRHPGASGSRPGAPAPPPRGGRSVDQRRHGTGRSAALLPAGRRGVDERSTLWLRIRCVKKIALTETPAYAILSSPGHTVSTEGMEKRRFARYDETRPQLLREKQPPGKQAKS